MKSHKTAWNVHTTRHQKGAEMVLKCPVGKPLLLNPNMGSKELKEPFKDFKIQLGNHI